ncbi:MAG: hypothetical protein BAA04_07865 [Firmicutes bacterium ZCTH02-B6]|nr:MAG: hypothetical protein BAA04_07865 [Firmicutes bacterium ZCTH02-B6]
MRTVIWVAVAIVLVLAALTYGRALLAPTEPAAVRELTVHGFEYDFDPKELTVHRGETVRLLVRNTGTIEHDLTIPDWDAATPLLSPGEEAILEFQPTRSGTFRFLCTVPGHNELGMNGTIRVE